MLNKTYKLETLVCPSCTIKIEGALKKINGVDDVKVLFNASKVKVVVNDDIKDVDIIRKTIENLGYKVLSEK